MKKSKHLEILIKHHEIRYAVLTTCMLDSVDTKTDIQRVKIWDSKNTIDVY